MEAISGLRYRCKEALKVINNLEENKEKATRDYVGADCHEESCAQGKEKGNKSRNPEFRQAQG